MLAIDTNIIVRYVVGDGGREFARAVEIVESNQVSVALTVLLETEWVLRDAYGYPSEVVLSAFEKLFGLPNFFVDEPRVVRKAIELTSVGLDFADALHLAQVVERGTFVTFDKALAKRASRHSGVTVRLA